MSKSSPTKRTVLITGCSDDSLGAALAIAFHKAGLHVYATARNPAKLSQVSALGIETLTLDVMNQASIDSAAAQVKSLDILVNNAGAPYPMPFSDLDLNKAKEIFDLNVWSYLAVTQAFLPHLLKSKGMIVNQTSSASVLAIPFQATYNASKAAMAVFSDTQRLELKPFGITVVDIKAGVVRSNMEKLSKDPASTNRLPPGSLFEPAKETVELTMSGARFFKGAMELDAYGDHVVGKLLAKNPPMILWTGAGPLTLMRAMLLLPHGWLDGMVSKMTGLDVVYQKVAKVKSS